ncbi:MAG: tRNA (adenosine(37)-N6)-threonylcarbamoyltransferase complex transferase subunit TsaD [Candidatus Parcubacteria bacterium]|nr:tRNA (adenosine(37)-N6)-threonylcarbamoyltransferase complex transferase subunit TsaD [Candidatus Parcubacteria bacterium]
MNILAIETSCDETAISIIATEENSEKKSITILANVVISQIEIHKPYGGVFPALAKREHAKNLVPVLAQSLEKADMLQTKTSEKISEEKQTELASLLEREPELLVALSEFIPTVQIPKIDYIAFTQGPGLPPALWVGLNFARAIALLWDTPLIPVNHMEGHLFSSLVNGKENVPQEIQNPKLPTLALLISGGHTEIVLMKDLFQYEVVGTTRDDAVGEAFDKAARILGLPYPGGPEISKRAKRFRERPSFAKATAGKQYKLPRPMLHSDDFDFSFSGIKTAVLYMVKKIEEMTEDIREEICYEFEEAVAETLMSKTLRAAEKYNPKTILMGGGVSANSYLQEIFKKTFQQNFPDAEISIPEKDCSTDNALMIAIAGYLRALHDPKSILSPDSEKIREMQADGNLAL